MTVTHYWADPKYREYPPKGDWNPPAYGMAACGNPNSFPYSTTMDKVTCDSCRAVMASLSRPAGTGAAPVDAEAASAEAPKAGSTEAVDHPPHYVGAAPGSLECIDAIDALVSQMKTESGFYAAQVLKYMWAAREEGQAARGFEEGAVVPQPTDQEAGGQMILGYVEDWFLDNLHRFGGMRTLSHHTRGAEAREALYQEALARWPEDDPGSIADSMRSSLGIAVGGRAELRARKPKDVQPMNNYDALLTLVVQLYERLGEKPNGVYMALARAKK